MKKAALFFLFSPYILITFWKFKTNIYLFIMSSWKKGWYDDKSVSPSEDITHDVCMLKQIIFCSVAINYKEVKFILVRKRMIISFLCYGMLCAFQ